MSLTIKPGPSVAGDTVPLIINNKVVIVVGGDKKPAEDFNAYIRPLFEDKKPVVLKTDLPEFIKQLIMLLIRNKVLTEEAANRVLVTFGKLKLFFVFLA